MLASFEAPKSGEDAIVFSQNGLVEMGRAEYNSSKFTEQVLVLSEPDL